VEKEAASKRHSPRRSSSPTESQLGALRATDIC
jgi:hypothetical protein